MVHPGKIAESALAQTSVAQTSVAQKRALESAASCAVIRSGSTARVVACLSVASALVIASACSTSGDGRPSVVSNGGRSGLPAVGAGGEPVGAGGFLEQGHGPNLTPPPEDCPKRTCAELGWECGYAVDKCNQVLDCANEGRTCSSNQVCIGGVDGPTKCVAGGGVACELCSAIPKCSNGAVTHLTGRVLTPGRDDANIGNQVGVPNAIVYILQTNKAADLPTITTGIPLGGTSCDRCEDQDFGRVLNGTVTDATGHFKLDEFIPVGQEFLLVVKAGRFRRATQLTLPQSAACQTTDLPTTLPDNPTRLPRSMSDGSAVNIPRIAVTTGRVDAIECVLSKMGIATTEFSNPATPVSAGPARINLYRGGPKETPRGASMNAMTPHDSTLYGSETQLESYDILVSDCEGIDWDKNGDERGANGANVRHFVNRGGRMFASHLSFSWLNGNGTQPYAADTAVETGLAPVGTWTSQLDEATTGIGVISQMRPNTAPRIQNFTDWMVNEQITSAPDFTFNINEPRSLNTGLGSNVEEFVYLKNGTERTQQFSFNTPYGSPKEAVCGRVAYSGFHVAVASESGSGGAPGAGGGFQGPPGGSGTPFDNVTFPEHCEGDLTKQEKVLLYMLFDLGACIGVVPPPKCEPVTCGKDCGMKPDGCGTLLDCGACRIP